MDLLRSCLVLQELIFQATIRGNSNWIRFPVNSKLHVMISRGKIPRIKLEHVSIDGNMCEIKV